ncbi:MAG: sugar-binding domain-containing protein [Bacteroidota bacterium]
MKYELKTRWTDQVSERSPWPEYPRPQMTRPDWINLNGSWDYAILDSGQREPKIFQGQIRVPFAIESSLSQVKKLVGKKRELWYRKQFRLSPHQKNEKWILHFGAVDWRARVYLNGKLIGEHKGGYTPFSFDITPFIKGRNQELVVSVWDPTDQGLQARGKQLSEPKGIWYTPVTGIWQTVWLEKVNRYYVTDIRPTPDLKRQALHLSCEVNEIPAGGTVEAIAYQEGVEVGRANTPLTPGQSSTSMMISLSQMRAWSPQDPFLYDLIVMLKDAQGKVLDKLGSYFGMRSIELGKDANGYTCFLLNGQPTFQMGLLDQGWWPDGLYTAPTEAAMKYDLEITQKLGFNMLRKHVKVEPARFYYLCDKMGLLVWQDMPNGNYFKGLRVPHDGPVDAKRPLSSSIQFENELKEMIDFLYSFPSIVTWVPFNEGWGQYETERVTHWVKNYDPSRICDAVSGWADRGTGDMIDVHIYPGPGMEPPEEKRASVVGEFGGLGWPVKDHLWWDKKNWGYRNYSSKEAYNTQFIKLIKDLIPLRSWGLAGAIYTQTTDVEGEVNGIITYDRELIKLDLDSTYSLISQLYKPAWNKRSIIPDSELENYKWQTSDEEPEAGWTKNEFDSQDWENLKAPFLITPNPFLLPGTSWEPKQSIYLRQEFYLGSMPENLSVKIYANQVDMEWYLNGHKIEVPDGIWGRKRHYSHKLVNDYRQHLQLGKNTFAIKLTSKSLKSVFDLGMYESKIN